MEGNYIKIATRWCSFEEKKINNLRIKTNFHPIFANFDLYTNIVREALREG